MKPTIIITIFFICIGGCTPPENAPKNINIKLPILSLGGNRKYEEAKGYDEEKLNIVETFGDYNKAIESHGAFEYEIEYHHLPQSEQ